MSTETNKATVRRMIDQVWNKRRVDLIEEFYAEDYVGHNPGVPPTNGLEAAKAETAMGLNAFPDLKLSIDDAIAEGDQVAARWTMRGTHQGELYGIPATGKQVTQEGAVVYRLVNARIAELWFYPDNLGLMQQLGVVPEMAEA